ncbi:hypothetical protein ES707_09199 [subsurface metagenome]
MVNRPKCAVEGCNNLALPEANGTYHQFCTKHHREKYGQPNISGKEKIRARFIANECVLCGWKGPCDRHRLKLGKDGGKYIKGNIVILCPNCHRLLHRGKLTIK